MKTISKLMATVLAGAMMISVCSCTEKPAEDTTASSEDVVTTTTETTTEASTATETERDTSETTKTEVNYSDTTCGQVLKLMNDVIGKDRAEAEKMIGEFFGVEVEDGHALDAKINDVPVWYYVYVQMFTKDSVRFNGMDITTDREKGIVQCIELNLSNSSYVNVAIEDTPEFRDEIRKQYSAVKEEFDNVYGDACEKGNPEFDEDSFYLLFKKADGSVDYVELRDFTEEGGNGLVEMTIISADDEHKILQ